MRNNNYNKTNYFCTTSSLYTPVGEEITLKNMRINSVINKDSYLNIIPVDFYKENTNISSIKLGLYSIGKYSIFKVSL